MIVIDGITFVVINVLLLLMQIAGPTPVAGTTGTTGALTPKTYAVDHARLR